MARGGDAVSIGEQNAAVCEAIDGGGVGLGMASQTTDPIIQIVDCDKKDVGLRIGQGLAPQR